MLSTRDPYFSLPRNSSQFVRDATYSYNILFIDT